jgi:hypothetical protein
MPREIEAPATTPSTTAGTAELAISTTRFRSCAWPANAAWCARNGSSSLRTRCRCSIACSTSWRAYPARFEAVSSRRSFMQASPADTRISVLPRRSAMHCRSGSQNFAAADLPSGEAGAPLPRGLSPHAIIRRALRALRRSVGPQGLYAAPRPGAEVDGHARAGNRDQDSAGLSGAPVTAAIAANLSDDKQSAVAGLLLSRLLCRE